MKIFLVLIILGLTILGFWLDWQAALAIIGAAFFTNMANDL